LHFVFFEYSDTTESLENTILYLCLMFIF